MTPLSCFSFSPWQGRFVHGFFGSGGGFSRSPFTGLNGDLHKGDDATLVHANRRLAMQALGVGHGPLVVAHQCHGHRVAIVDDAKDCDLLAVDGLITRTPGLALGVVTADCAPLLLADDDVIGVCHAGWRGALAGIVEATVEAMRTLGARHIVGVMGPVIRAGDYRVDQAMYQEFLTHNTSFADYFSPASPQKPGFGDYLFDLPSFIKGRAQSCEMVLHDMELESYANPWFFSRRRASEQGYTHHGCGLSLLMLPLPNK